MKSALIVIDVQRGLFDDAPRPFEADAVVARINALAAAARAAGAPVVFVQHETASAGLQHGSVGWALERGLQVEPGDPRVRKTTPDSFLRTPLGDLLAAADVNHLVLCGYATEFCVDTTTRRAAALGYGVLLAADAHTTHDKAHASAAQIRAHHNATLPNISSFGPVIRALPSAEIRFDA
jgi:nicotinamidase-related amidase